MAKDKLILRYPVAVEGKYDKIRLSNVIGSQIIVLNGFSAFNDENTIKTLKKSAPDGLILLTDPDKAGTFMRGKLKGLLQGINVINVYAPTVRGNDSRRNHVCKDGVLGVESIDENVLYGLLLPYAVTDGGKKRVPFLTPARAYADGLSGNEKSAKKRGYICEKLDLPRTISAKMLFEHINLNVGEDEYIKLLESYEEDDK